MLAATHTLTYKMQINANKYSQITSGYFYALKVGYQVHENGLNKPIYK